MPKIIKDLRETILAETRRQLFCEDSEAVTMRSVAAGCHIAVGTLYNYFPSRDMMIATVMLDDWLTALQQMRSGAEASASLAQGLRAINDPIVAFSAMYSGEWHSNPIQPASMPEFAARHRQLIRQLCDICQILIRKFCGSMDSCYAEAAMQLLLARTNTADAQEFDELLPVLLKLLS